MKPSLSKILENRGKKDQREQQQFEIKSLILHDESKIQDDKKDQP
jgi:hypothetical protein